MKHFKNFKEAYEDLLLIRPLDSNLSNPQKLEDVMPVVKRIAVNLLKSEYLNLTEEEVNVYSYELKRLGMTPYKKAAKCFVTESKALGEIIDKEGSIEFPLSAFTQMIDSSYDTATYGLAKMSGWMLDWLKAQGIQEEKIEDFVKEYNAHKSEPKHFKSFEEVMDDLNKIPPYKKDLSQHSEIEEVMPTTKRIVANLLASNSYEFTPEEAEIYTNKLKDLGCRTYKEVNNGFRKDGLTVGTLLKLKDDIGFPISAFSQIIDRDNNNFNLNLDFMAEGDEYSWLATWLDTQGTSYGEINDFVKEFDDKNAPHIDSYQDDFGDIGMY